MPKSLPWLFWLFEEADWLGEFDGEDKGGVENVDEEDVWDTMDDSEEAAEGIVDITAWVVVME